MIEFFYDKKSIYQSTSFISSVPLSFHSHFSDTRYTEIYPHLKKKVKSMSPIPFLLPFSRCNYCYFMSISDTLYVVYSLTYINSHTCLGAWGRKGSVSPLHRQRWGLRENQSSIVLLRTEREQPFLPLLEICLDCRLMFSVLSEEKGDHEMGTTSRRH